MIETEIPKNILKHKVKVVAGLSLREISCGVCGAAIGLLSYFYLFEGLGESSARIGLSGFLALPLFLIGFMQLYDQPFEKMAYIIVMENLIYPPKRPYATKYGDNKPIGKKTEKNKTIKPSKAYKPIR